MASASGAILHNVAVGTVPLVLGLLVALVISGQVLMLLERHRSTDSGSVTWPGAAMLSRYWSSRCSRRARRVQLSEAFSAPLAAVGRWASSWLC